MDQNIIMTKGCLPRKDELRSFWRNDLCCFLRTVTRWQSVDSLTRPPPPSLFCVCLPFNGKAFRYYQRHYLRPMLSACLFMCTCISVVVSRCYSDTIWQHLRKPHSSQGHDTESLLTLPLWYRTAPIGHDGPFCTERRFIFCCFLRTASVCTVNDPRASRNLVPWSVCFLHWCCNLCSARWSRQTWRTATWRQDPCRRKLLWQLHKELSDLTTVCVNINCTMSELVACTPLR